MFVRTPSQLSCAVKSYLESRNASLVGLSVPNEQENPHIGVDPLEDERGRTGDLSPQLQF